MKINYLRGDATRPNIPAGKHAYILHVCNNRGGWGAGFVLALSRRWTQPELYYREHYRKYGLPLGGVQFIQVESNITVCNMIAQDGFSRPSKPDVIDYESLEYCLKSIHSETSTKDCIYVGPKFGSGLAGGDWNKIEVLITKNLHRQVYIYEL